MREHSRQATANLTLLGLAKPRIWQNRLLQSSAASSSLDWHHQAFLMQGLCPLQKLLVDPLLLELDALQLLEVKPVLLRPMLLKSLHELRWRALELLSRRYVHEESPKIIFIDCPIAKLHLLHRWLLSRRWHWLARHHLLVSCLLRWESIHWLSLGHWLTNWLVRLGHGLTLHEMIRRNLL